MKKNMTTVRLGLALSALFLLAAVIPAQEAKPLLKRIAYKSDKIDFGAGGTIAVVGAPVGSISIEGWRSNEVEISAEIETQAGSEADLALLAEINGFMVDADFGRISIMSVGVHDKRYVKRTAKKFPKRLLNAPFRIDYHIKVPLFSDLEVDGGRGDFVLSGVEGAMRINFLESNAKMDLIGGDFSAVFGSGTVEAVFGAPSWRGRGAEIQLAGGTLAVWLPLNLSAEVDATILRTGQIENEFEFLKPRDRSKFTERSLAAKAGNGGAKLSFTVGDGTLKLARRKQ